MTLSLRFVYFVLGLITLLICWRYERLARSRPFVGTHTVKGRMLNKEQAVWTPFPAFSWFAFEMLHFRAEMLHLADWKCTFLIIWEIGSLSMHLKATAISFSNDEEFFTINFRQLVTWASIFQFRNAFQSPFYRLAIRARHGVDHNYLQPECNLTCCWHCILTMFSR